MEEEDDHDDGLHCCLGAADGTGPRFWSDPSSTDGGAGAVIYELQGGIFGNTVMVTAEGNPSI